MIGAGNTSGILAIAVFLTPGTRTAGVIFVAKVCLLAYAVGFGAFFCAYRLLYKTAGRIEDGLIALRRGRDCDGNVSKAIDQIEKDRHADPSLRRMFPLGEHYGDCQSSVWLG
jgi:hypothetical protein